MRHTILEKIRICLFLCETLCFMYHNFVFCGLLYQLFEFYLSIFIQH